MSSTSRTAPAGSNRSSYARAIGYTGSKPVIVCDGKVVSHRSVCWFSFCDRLKDSARRAAR